MAAATRCMRVVLGDQLSDDIAALNDIDPAHDVVLMAEVMAECTYVKHHSKKIVLILSAMRHFAQGLRDRGVRVDYIALDDPANTQSLRAEVQRAVARYQPDRVVATECGEWRLDQDMAGWAELMGIEVDIRADTRFLCSRQAFRVWAADRRSLRMEFFYRDMRRRHDVLMQDNEPVGGQWNFDAENRKPLPKGAVLPPIPSFAPDAITRAVMAMVADRFSSHFGAVDGFDLPVTAADAEAALADFIAHRLPQFGDWQDAMRTGAPVMHHALISPAMNIGLLDPMQVCRAAEAAWNAGHAPLNAVEGFIRQILGWREYVRGVYWLKCPEYRTLNGLEATRALPGFYWSGDTKMNCLHQAISDTRRYAYAHHIQRLMLTGNFALLAGLHPDAVDDWYLSVYADAFEWVEMPNTRGMALHADGGVMGSKPYAASGAYINRMSDYCGKCRYDVKAAVGDDACPFNALYWDFIARHEDRFGGNPRMAMPVRTMHKMDPAKIAAIRARAATFLAAMDAGAAV